MKGLVWLAICNIIEIRNVTFKKIVLLWSLDLKSKSKIENLKIIVSKTLKIPKYKFKLFFQKKIV